MLSSSRSSLHKLAKNPLPKPETLTANPFSNFLIDNANEKQSDENLGSKNFFF